VTLREDNVRREVELALLSSKLPLTLAELRSWTGREGRELADVLREMEEMEVVLRLDTFDADSWTLTTVAVQVLTIIGRGGAPLDRHVAEALEVREKGLDAGRRPGSAT
jgi:hypothetical protein